MVSPCVIPCYRIIPIKNSVRAQDDKYFRIQQSYRNIYKHLLGIHSSLMNLNGSDKASHLYICGMIMKLPQKRFEYMLEMSP